MRELGVGENRVRATTPRFGAVVGVIATRATKTTAATSCGTSGARASTTGTTPACRARRPYACYLCCSSTEFSRRRQTSAWHACTRLNDQIMLAETPPKAGLGCDTLWRRHHALYGLRCAASAFQRHLGRFLRDIVGFNGGRAAQSVHFRELGRLRMFVRVDGQLVIGPCATVMALFDLLGSHSAEKVGYPLTDGMDAARRSIVPAQPGRLRRADPGQACRLHGGVARRRQEQAGDHPQSEGAPPE